MLFDFYRVVYFDDDNKMRLRADMISQIAYRNYFQALDAFIDRIVRE